MDPTETPQRTPLEVVEGGSSSPLVQNSVDEAARWKSWVAVLLSVILVLVMMHMGGIEFSNPVDSLVASPLKGR